MSRNSANGSTTRWRNLRAEKLARQPLCEWAQCREPATEVDHIKPLKNGRKGATCGATYDRCARGTTRLDTGSGRGDGSTWRQDGQSELASVSVGIGDEVGAKSKNPHRGWHKRVRRPPSGFVSS